jgi:DNA-binding transcriptional LysR family regulator
MTAFVWAARLGGFSAAARELSLTPSGVSKLVTRLEDRMGVRLLNRTTRKISLTAEGAAYFERARRIVADIEEAEAEVAGFRKRPKGKFRLNVLVGFGRSQLIPALPRFVERYPEIQLELELSDRRVDMVGKEVELAIRLGKLHDSSLVARKICDVHRVICAAPSYIARNGMPRRPEDLLRHNCMSVSPSQLEPDLVPSLWHWPFDTRQGRQVIEVSGNVSASDGEALLELALSGIGIVRLSDFAVGPEIAKGTLQPLLAAIHYAESIPLQAVYSYGRHRSPKVAAMVEFLLEQFGNAPWRNAKPFFSPP